MQENLHSYQPSLEGLTSLFTDWYKDIPDYDEKLRLFPESIKKQYIQKAIQELDSSKIQNALRLIKLDPRLCTEAFLVNEILPYKTTYDAPAPSGDWEMVSADVAEEFIKIYPQPLSQETLLALIQTNRLRVLDNLLEGGNSKEKLKNLDLECLKSIVFILNPKEKPSPETTSFSEKTARIFVEKYPSLFEVFWKHFNACSQKFAEFMSKGYFGVPILARNPNQITEIPPAQVADILIQNGKLNEMLRNFSAYPDVEPNELIRKLLKLKKIHELRYCNYAKNITGLTLETAILLAQQGEPYLVVDLHSSFSNVTGDQIFELIETYPKDTIDSLTQVRNKFSREFGFFKEINHEKIFEKMVENWKDIDLIDFSFGKMQTKISQASLEKYIHSEHHSNVSLISNNLNFFEITDYSELSRWFAKKDYTIFLGREFLNWNYKDTYLNTIKEIYPRLNEAVGPTLFLEILKYLITHSEFSLPHQETSDKDFHSWVIQLMITAQKGKRSTLVESEPSIQFIHTLYEKDEWGELLSEKNPITQKNVYENTSHSSFDFQIEILIGLRGKTDEEAIQKLETFAGNTFFSGLVKKAIETYHIFEQYSEEQIKKALWCYKKIDVLAKTLELPVEPLLIEQIFKRLNDEIPESVNDEKAFDFLWEKLSQIDDQELIDIKDSLWQLTQHLIFPLLLLKSGDVFKKPKEAQNLKKLSKKKTLELLLFDTNPQITALGLPLTISELVLFSKEKHRPDHMLPATVTNLKDERSWYPLFQDTSGMGIGSLQKVGEELWSITPLTHTVDLVNEGNDLGHCVGYGEYGTECSKGKIHILSIRKLTDHGWKRSSTAEVAFKDNELLVKQHRARKNQQPEKGATKALENLIEEIKMKELPITSQFGETQESKLNREESGKIGKEYPFLLEIGFVPTSEKIKAVIEHYLSLTWKKTSKNQAIRSLFAIDGKLIRDPQEKFSFTRNLFIGGKEMRKATMPTVLEAFGPIFDSLLDPIFENKKKEILETRELLDVDK